MYEKLLCKHLEDADRLEIIEIKRITDHYIIYQCPLCKVEGKIKGQVFFNKWEFWKFLDILKSASKHSGSLSQKCFSENILKICKHLYNRASTSTLKFSEIEEERKSEFEIDRENLPE
ncbi:hypothetical protein KKB99_07535 [bacterium]|nr:hypothetical protein [bacterium]MBU1025844.1 hypothetical protein [bacterium]